MAICKSSLSGICTQYIYRTQSRVVCAKPRRFSFFCVVMHQMVADCIIRQRIRGHSDMPPLRKQECGRVKARLTVRQKTGAAPNKSLPYRRTYIWFILCRKKGILVLWLAICARCLFMFSLPVRTVRSRGNAILT